MPFEPLKLARHGGAAITLDVQYRLRISAEAMRELKLSPYQYVIISVDVENKRIGIVKLDLAKVPNASAIKVDKRGYLGTKAGKEVMRKLALIDSDLPVRFVDIGNFDEGTVYWRAFELAE
jgi:hypothetical protein